MAGSPICRYKLFIPNPSRNLRLYPHRIGPNPKLSTVPHYQAFDGRDDEYAECVGDWLEVALDHMKYVVLGNGELVDENIDIDDVGQDYGFGFRHQGTRIRVG